MITIWGRLNSHNVKKIAWAAIDMGLTHRRIDMGGSFGYTPEYLVMNPNRLVPTIEDDSVAVSGDKGFSLWESNAILRYLADAHAPDYRPDDAAARAQGDRWMDWQFQFADAQRVAFLGFVRHAKDERDPEVARSLAATDAMMDLLETTLAAQPWLAGERFGIADIPMGVYTHTYFALPVERPPLPHVRDWYARLQTRPGYTSQVMIPLT